MAYSCNPATGRPGEVDDLRSGQLLDGHLRWTGVRTKLDVDMVNEEESSLSRSTKDGRIGSGRKLSSQKAARRCSSGIAPVSGCHSAARSIKSHLHLFIFVKCYAYFDSVTWFLIRNGCECVNLKKWINFRKKIPWSLQCATEWSPIGDSILFKWVMYPWVKLLLNGHHSK